MTLNNYLVYLAFGKEEHLRETLFSLLTFYRCHQDTTGISVLIFTDQPDFFQKFLPQEVTYYPLDCTTIETWKGPDSYLFRIKTKTMEALCSNYKGNFLFVDSDTVFLRNVSPLFERIQKGTLLLDRCEGRLCDNPGGIARKTRRFLKAHPGFRLASDPKPIQLDETFTAWNSGTAGFTHAQEKTFHCVVELMDQMYAASRLFVVEQLALSYYFQQSGQPEATEAFLHHYWDFKEFRLVLADFFQHYSTLSFEEMIPLSAQINPIWLAAEKRSYKKLSFWGKQWRKISKGKKWGIPSYQLQ